MWRRVAAALRCDAVSLLLCPGGYKALRSFETSANTQRHGATSQNTWISSNIAVGNLKCYIELNGRILLKRISNKLRGCEVALCSSRRVQCKNAVKANSRILLKRIPNKLRGCEVALCSSGRVQCKNAVNANGRILLKRIPNKLGGCEIALCSSGRVRWKKAVNATLIVLTFRYGSKTVEYLMRSSLTLDTCRWVINSRRFQEK